MVALSYMVNNGWSFNVAYTFELANDLDFSNAILNEAETSTYSTVDNFEPIGNGIDLKMFSANFDGKNKTISNLKITQTTSTTKKYYGLFGLIMGQSENTTVFKNINIENAKIEVSNIGTFAEDVVYVGAFCGMFSNIYYYLSLDNVSVKNSDINVNIHTRNDVGAVVGFMQVNTGIQNIIASAVNNCTSESNTVRNEIGYLGGFYGCSYFSASNNFHTKVENDTVKFWYGNNETQANTISNNTLITTSIAVDEIGLEYSYDQSRLVNNNLLQSFESRNPNNNNNNNIVRGNRFNADAIYLYTNKWNFVARLGDKFEELNSNILQTYNQTTDLHMDMGATNFVYGSEESTDGANNWNTTFLYASDSMITGAGYFVWPFNNTVGSDWNAVATDTNHYTTKIIPVLLTETPENNTLSLTNYGIAPTGGTESGYWYAFGNPFDKSLPVSALIDVTNANSSTNSCVYISGNEQSTQVQGSSVYVYDSYSNNWTILNENDSILPGQGFMVSTNETGKTANFRMIYPSNEQNQLPAQVSNGIKFNTTFNGLTSSMFAKQENNAQDGFDQKDAYILFGNDANRVEPYFVVENNAVKHNRYNSDNYSCAVNFHSQKSGVAELSVSDIPDGTTVSIVDLVMNTETILNDEAYQIDIEAGENSGRYLIKINKGSVSLPQTIENEANISIWNNNKEIFIKGDNLQRVEVYNTLGQMVYQKQISGQEYNFTISTKGAYIIKSLSKNGTKTKKIVIK